LFFDVPCVFLFFCFFFSSLKNIKTSGRGEHNHSHSYVLTRGYPIQKKMAKILKAPKFKSPQKKTAKFRRKLSTSVPSSRSLGIWVSPPGRQNGTNSHVDQVEKLNFGCFGSPAFIPNTEKTWLVVEPPLWKILVKWDYCFQYTGKKTCSKPPTRNLYWPLKILDNARLINS
jgi:hypothetical protein